MELALLQMADRRREVDGDALARLAVSGRTRSPRLRTALLRLARPNRRPSPRVA
jgi:hypothetical protein